MIVSIVLCVMIYYLLVVCASDRLVLIYQISWLYEYIEMSHYMINILVYGDEISCEYFYRSHDIISEYQ